MKKVIEGVIPFPIDCEVRLGSVFASLLTGLNPDIPQGMAICNNTYRRNGNLGDPCTSCGNCRGWTIADKEYFKAANEYAFVSGQALIQFDMTYTDQAARNEILLIETCGDYLELMFGYAGYPYTIMDSADSKVDMYDAIKASIDRGKPVLFECKADNIWIVVTGYGDGMTLYGYDGLNWYTRMKPAPDSYDGSLFCSANWYEAVKCIALIGEKGTPTKTLDDVIARNASLMKRTFDGDFYKKASDYILDDSNFNADADNLKKQARLINDFVGLPIGGRSIVSWFAFERLEKECAEDLRKTLERIGGCCCDIHEICWIVWRALDCEEKHIKLVDPLYRKMIADVVRLLGYKDFHIYESLRDYAKRHPAS